LRTPAKVTAATLPLHIQRRIAAFFIRQARNTLHAGLSEAG